MFSHVIPRSSAPRHLALRVIHPASGPQIPEIPILLEFIPLGADSKIPKIPLVQMPRRRVVVPDPIYADIFNLIDDDCLTVIIYEIVLTGGNPHIYRQVSMRFKRVTDLAIGMILRSDDPKIDVSHFRQAMWIGMPQFFYLFLRNYAAKPDVQDEEYDNEYGCGYNLEYYDHWTSSARWADLRIVDASLQEPTNRVLQ